MHVLVIYESMFGATRQVAQALAEAASQTADIAVRRVDQVGPEEVGAADLLVLGAPTHAHTLSRPESRRTAEEWGRDPEKGLRFEADAQADGVREFIEALPTGHVLTAAFDTRADMPEIFTGSAARAIAKRLAKKGYRSVAAPESFLVTKTAALLDGELEHARRFGRTLVSAARSSQEAMPA